MKTAEEYRERAKQVRALADSATSVSLKATFLQIAAGYDELAEYAADIERRPPHLS
jgi:hypothetical protein